jgi:hypothetical protein
MMAHKSANPPPKEYTLTLPDGVRLPGFFWSALGVYVRFFPDSGVHSGPANTLQFTPKALEAAGIALEESPAGQPQFAAVRLSVMQGARHICTAISGTFAKRIARALNLHSPDERGV